MNKISPLIAQLEAKITLFEQQDPSISQENIGWHIAHSLLVCTQIVRALSASDPKLYHWKFNAKYWYLRIKNSIPRGVGRAPKSVQPRDIIDIESLKSQIALSKLSMETLKTLPKNSFFEHPYLGALNLKNTLWFLELHTNHHLKIIDDIAKSQHSAV